MAKFHRFRAPTYTSAPVLGPGDAAPVVFEGKDYDFFNVNNEGGGGGFAAFTDVVKGVGPNKGTYCVAFGEDASSLNANRGFKALSENTDTIDDILHQDVAIPTRTAEVTPLAPVATIDLPANTFVGTSKSYPIEMLFKIVDGMDREVLDAGAIRITVASIAGAAIGDDFSAGIVTLNLSNDIPTGQTYRVYYAERGNIATLPMDAFSYSQIRTAAVVDAVIQDVLQQLHGGVGALWNDTWTSTIHDLAFSGLNERYRRGATVDPNNAQHPVAYTQDTPGAGGWYERLSAGIVGFSADDTVADFTGTFDRQDHLYGAGWGYIASRKLTTTTHHHRMGYDSGFVYLGRKGTSIHDPTDGSGGMFGFFHGAQRLGGDANARTKLAEGLAFSITGDVITLDVAGWFYDAGGDSAIAEGYDLLTVDIGGVLHNFVIGDITARRVAQVCYQDGSIPNLAPAAGTVVRWVSPLFFTGDGAPEALELGADPFASQAKLRGFFYATGPILESLGTDPSPWAEAPASFYGRQRADDGSFQSMPVLQWGAYDPTIFQYVPLSALMSSGAVQATSFCRTKIKETNLLADDVVTLDGSIEDVLVVTNAGGGVISIDGVGINKLQQGQEVHVIVKSNAIIKVKETGATPLAARWTAGGGSISMEPSDYQTSMASSHVDWWSFINIGTYAVPLLIGRVRRIAL
jgi:hypothetical protein